MKPPRERILLVENDIELSDLISRQTLQPLGYRVQVARTTTAALQEAPRFSPDLAIADLVLPDLSGKDLLVALASQGLDIPVIVLAQKGMEGDVIQAFRLGATDFLYCPVREAEIVTAVERVLNQVRARKEREALARQLKHTNEELHRRVRELTTIYALGKAVTSITDLDHLFEKIVEGAIYISEADCGWFLLREGNNKTYLLKAQHRLPSSLAARLHQPWDDGVSSLVALSGEALAIHGEPLARFKIAELGQAVLVAPVKVKKDVIGLLVVVRKELKPFGPSNKALLESVADYASIAIVNARLFRALEDKARSLQQMADAAEKSERAKGEFIEKTWRELASQLSGVSAMLDSLLVGEGARLNATQKGVLRAAHDRLERVAGSAQSLASPVHKT